MPEVKIYNTLTRSKEVFQPIDNSHVRVYACGPTVYDYAHIGNARMAVTFDLLVRVLKKVFSKVTYVSNITDIDDKIIEASRKTGLPINEITEKYTKIYNEDMASLGVELPDIQPKATEHIRDMISLIQTLIKRGHAYEEQGHVLFDVLSFPAYGGLSGRSREDQIAGARVEIAPYKKDASDFVLWKPSSEDQPGWDSPWGRGRPGWHIECSAMSEQHLGLPFDIHGGGADLKFPHHENEIAQSCCAHGNENDLSAFSKYWVHNGFLTVNSEKMSKSLGNITLVHNLLEKVHGETVRLTLLSAHYRQPLDWSDEAILNSKRLLDRLYSILNQCDNIEPEMSEVPESFMSALCDDINTPQAIAEINKIAKELANASDDKKPLLKGMLLQASDLLGILNSNPKEWLGFSEQSHEIDDLVQKREEARKNKNFSLADQIRDQLLELGVVVEDTPTGPQWKKVS
jgi:cysteinyl-tRNA synthetase